MLLQVGVNVGIRVGKYAGVGPASSSSQLSESESEGGDHDDVSPTKCEGIGVLCQRTRARRGFGLVLGIPKSA